MRRALTGILASPNFLFRSDQGMQRRWLAGVQPLTDLSLASRLSFFLWSSLPDEQLLQLAEQGQLRDPAVLKAQVQRMLHDPRSGTLVSNFAASG